MFSRTGRPIFSAYFLLRIDGLVDASPPADRAERLCPGGSDIDLFRYGKSMIDLDAKVAHRALDLRMAKQELHGS